MEPAQEEVVGRELDSISDSAVKSQLFIAAIDLLWEISGMLPVGFTLSRVATWLGRESECFT